MNSTDGGAPVILHRDDQLVLVDKPPGIPVQADRTGDESLLDRVRALFPGREIGSPHRLDRPVSGVTLFTFGAAPLRAMDALFRDRLVEKTYLAIVEGRTEGEGELAHRLEHAAGGRKAQARAGEANARLAFRALAAGDRYSLLEVVPQGGAFHQIRAQLAAGGNPIKGDVKYGARRGEADRSIGLHAWRLAFRHPATGTRLAVEAPVPGRSIWPALARLAGLLP